MKTGLVLGGGGARGSYQLGVWRALLELGICPDVITGSSVGALNGALMVQNSYHIAVNLWKTLTTTSVFDFPKEPDFLAYTRVFLRQGGACRTGLELLIKKYLQEEKIRASSISLGMMLVRKADLAPCPIFTEEIPKGMLCDYLMATTACFPAVKSHTISGVEYIDGVYCDNLPVELAKSKGATRIIAVSLDTKNTAESPFLQDDSVISIYPRWNLGNRLVFHKENTERNIRLGYLDALKAFNMHEGNFFSFEKNTFGQLYEKKRLPVALFHHFLKCRNKSPLKDLFPKTFSENDMLKHSAEITGKLLKLSPYRIYTAESFPKAIQRKLDCQKNSVLTYLLSQPPQTLLSYADEYPEETVATIFLSCFL